MTRKSKSLASKPADLKIERADRRKLRSKHYDLFLEGVRWRFHPGGEALNRIVARMRRNPHWVAGYVAGAELVHEAEKSAGARYRFPKGKPWLMP